MAISGKVQIFALSLIAILGTAYAGTACPNPLGADVHSGLCVFHPGGRYSHSYSTTVDPIVHPGRCVSPGTNSQRCAVQANPFSYNWAVGDNEYTNNPGTFVDCHLDPYVVVMNDAFLLQDPCNYNRCD